MILPIDVRNLPEPQARGRRIADPVTVRGLNGVVEVRYLRAMVSCLRYALERAAWIA